MNIGYSRLNDGYIKLLLVNSRVTGNIDSSEIILNLAHHLPFTRAQSFGNLRINAKSHQFVLAFAIHSFREPAGFFEQLVTDCLGRFDETATAAVLTRRTQCSLE